MQTTAKLSRKLGLTLVTCYGLGTILGAGIYVLVGKVSAAAGLLAPLAFAVAAIISFFTALSYARLVAIFPRCEGPAAYALEAFHHKTLSGLIGYLIILTGIVSAATITNGFVGYVEVFIPVSANLAMTILIIVLTLIAIWGIAESLWISAIMTFIEIGGLLLVIAIAGDVIIHPPQPVDRLFIPDSFSALFGVFAGAFLAFYAFIGFEDMVNIVEEVKNPGFNMPVAIFLAIVISSLLYILISVIAVSTLSIEQLGNTDAPLALILEGHSLFSSKLISIISIFAIVNGALIQIIMGSRVLYGMSREKLAPIHLAVINQKTKTPIYTTLVVSALVLGFALWLPIVTLAKLTSFIVLVIFLLVNLSLWRIKQIKTAEYNAVMHTVNFPITAAILCLLLIGFHIFDLLT